MFDQRAKAATTEESDDNRFISAFNTYNTNDLSARVREAGGSRGGIRGQGATGSRLMFQPDPDVPPTTTFNSNPYTSRQLSNVNMNNTNGGGNQSASVGDLMSESKQSFGESVGFDRVFKKQTIPAYIKKDNAFTTNAEKNITYLATHNGNLITSLDGKGPQTRRRLYRQNAFSKEEDLLKNDSNSNTTNKNDSFFVNRDTVPALNEAKIKSKLRHAVSMRNPPMQRGETNLANFAPNTTMNTIGEKNSLKQKTTRIPEKIISYVQTSNGTLVNRVPTFEVGTASLMSESMNLGNTRATGRLDESSSGGSGQFWPYEQSKSIKLHNPHNQLKRNASSLTNSFN